MDNSSETNKRACFKGMYEILQKYYGVTIPDNVDTMQIDTLMYTLSEDINRWGNKRRANKTANPN